MNLRLLRSRALRFTRRVRAQVLRVTQPGWSAPWGVQVGRWCRIQIDHGGTIRLGAGCELDDGVTVAATSGAVVDLAPGVFVGHHSTIAAASSVHIGAGTFLAELVSVRDHDHDETHPIASGAKNVEAVMIGADCWLASKVTVVRGASIGDGVIVGANSVVRGVLGTDVVAVGSPAVARRQRRRSSSHDG